MGLFPSVERFYASQASVMLKTITLIQDCPIAPDGVHVKWYKRGDVLELPVALADSMVRSKLAVAGSQGTKKLPEPALAPAVERVNLIESKPLAEEPVKEGEK